MSDTKTVKTSTQKSDTNTPLTSEQIRAITSGNKTGFPVWAQERYGKTHQLRWIAPNKLYNEDSGVDSRGYELVKNPKTGKIERNHELMLGIMPLDIAEERKAAVREDTLAQEQFVVDKIETMRERLKFEMKKSGYKTFDTQFDYNKK